ncbi:hypothetical protein CPB86DRAFT_216187 [Serendipita vermifera]|nr:hypothetical protein CPB86DRAFT_216187 [Serendipita vermifera]
MSNIGISPPLSGHADYSSYRSILNLIKQGHNLDIQYVDVSHGPSHAHVWCGEWRFRRRRDEEPIVIGAAESSRRDNAKELAAVQAVDRLTYMGYMPPPKNQY